MMTIPKLSDSASPGPGWFVESGPAGNIVALKCPNGHIGWLSTHKIAGDGTVTPSCICPRDGCHFHEHVKLNDWSEAMSKKTAPKKTESAPAAASDVTTPAAEAKEPSAKPCRAAEVGHVACDCGGPHCGDNATS